MGFVPNIVPIIKTFDYWATNMHQYRFYIFRLNNYYDSVGDKAISFYNCHFQVEFSFLPDKTKPMNLATKVLWNEQYRFSDANQLKFNIFGDFAYKNSSTLGDLILVDFPTKELEELIKSLN